MFVRGLALAVLSFTVASHAMADAKEDFEKAQGLYAKRGDAASVNEALKVLASAEAAATDDELKYDVLILTARTLYWQGVHTTSSSAKVKIHDLGYKKAKAAKELNGDLAEAYYWSAVNLARWGEANGVVSSLGKKQEVMDTINAIYEKQTRDGKDGADYEGNGADRTLGRLYFKLPSFAGGSLTKALTYLERAATNAKNFPINVNFYAEALASQNAAGKQAAKALLDDLLKQDPYTLNPARVPEALDEMADAKKLRKQLGN